MKYYEHLLEKGHFDREYLAQLTGSTSAADSLIRRYLKGGQAQRVRRDFYVMISPETRCPVPTRYEIGTAAFPDAVIVGHSAFEMYGCANQVYFECCVATSSHFSNFEYDGIAYRRVAKKPNISVTRVRGVAVTTPEQTAVDAIRDVDKRIGSEETIKCIELLPSLDENEMLGILTAEGNGFLYQKCGYIFEMLRDEFCFSDKFFDECKRHIPSTKRRAFGDFHGQLTLIPEWGLYVPDDFYDREEWYAYEA